MEEYETGEEEPSNAFDCSRLLKKHQDLWRNRYIPDRLDQIWELDRQISEYREHPIAARSDIPSTGGGDIKPDIVYLCKGAALFSTRRDNVDGDVFVDETMATIRDTSEELLRGHRYYCMYLYPFMLPKPDVYAMTPADYGAFHFYAKKRLQVLRPKVVMCFGQDPMKAMIGGLNKTVGNPNIYKIMGDGREQARVGVPFTRVLKFDGCGQNMTVIFCPHPYSLENPPGQAEFAEKMKDELRKQWDEAFAEAKRILTDLTVEKPAFKTLMDENDRLYHGTLIAKRRPTITGARADKVKHLSGQKSLECFSVKKVDVKELFEEVGEKLKTEKKRKRRWFGAPKKKKKQTEESPVDPPEESVPDSDVTSDMPDLLKLEPAWDLGVKMEEYE
jgi:hypothetical protein